MKVLHWPVNWGKTAALVRAAIRAEGVVVAKNQASKDYILGKWPEAEVYTFGETALDDVTKPLFIDDADSLLQQLLGNREIGGISLTMTKEELE